MAIEARISKTWRNRQLLLAAMLGGFGLWFIYDGAVGYPSKNVQFAEYEKLRERFGEDRAGLERAWEELSREKRWPRKAPKHPYDAEQVRNQFIMGGLAFAGAAYALGLLWVCSRRSVRSDGVTITGETGAQVPIAAVKRLDMKRWENKGIAVAYYEDAAGGGEKRLVLDDYKYAGAEEILKQVEAHLGVVRPGPAAEEGEASA